MTKEAIDLCNDLAIDVAMPPSLLRQAGSVLHPWQHHACKSADVQPRKADTNTRVITGAKKELTFLPKCTVQRCYTVLGWHVSLSNTRYAGSPGQQHSRYKAADLPQVAPKYLHLNML